MISIPHLSMLGLLAFTIVSCQEKQEKPDKQTARKQEAQFFDSGATLELNQLKNEMAKGETDLLRSFQTHKFPWQHWDKKLLDKARRAQSSIFVLVTNPLNESSRDLGNLLNSNEQYREQLSTHYVCTAVDVHAQPELGVLCYQLCAEIKQPVAFPMIMWLSHEGCPIAWFPMGKTEQSFVDRILQNSHAMIQDMWTREQAYSVQNSRQDNDRRQRRIDATLQKPEPHNADASPVPELGRQATFLAFARKIASFYNKHSKDLDGIGGLLPSSTLRLLSLQAAYPAAYQGTRQSSKEAVLGLYESISRGAIHDGVEGHYFYARRNYGWSLPSFSRDLVSQALLAETLFQSGVLLEEPEIIEEGRLLLQKLETDWLGNQPKFAISAGSHQDAKNVFLFQYSVLEKLLNPADFRVAREFFQLKPDGNIDSLNDSTRRYRGLNTLAPARNAHEIAESLGIPVANVKDAIPRIQQQIKDLRLKNGKLTLETSIGSGDLALFGSAQIASYRARPTPQALKSALETGKQLLRDYFGNNGTLYRFKGGFPACGGDYAQSGNFLLDLYLITFDEQWLKAAIQIIDEAIVKLGRENFPLTEISESDQVIPLKLHHTSMIFAESSLGRFDRAFGLLTALTGQPRYREQRELIWNALQSHIQHTPITHTDLLASSLIGAPPYQVILDGNVDAPEYQKVLKLLNHPKFVNFSVPRPATGKLLAPLPDLGPAQDELRLILVHGDQLVGQSGTFADFQKILEKALSKKE